MDIYHQRECCLLQFKDLKKGDDFWRLRKIFINIWTYQWSDGAVAEIWRPSTGCSTKPRLREKSFKKQYEIIELFFLVEIFNSRCWNSEMDLFPKYFIAINVYCLIIAAIHYTLCEAELSFIVYSFFSLIHQKLLLSYIFTFNVFRKVDIFGYNFSSVFYCLNVILCVMCHIENVL